jgi:hypothetical protein
VSKWSKKKARNGWKIAAKNNISRASFLALASFDACFRAFRLLLSLLQSPNA